MKEDGIHAFCMGVSGLVLGSLNERKGKVEIPRWRSIIMKSMVMSIVYLYVLVLYSSLQ